VREEELYERLLSKILELQDFINKPETVVSDSAARIHTKLLHLRGRVGHLQLLGQSSTKIDRAGIQTLEERLEAMAQQVTAILDLERRDAAVRDVDSRDSVNTQGVSGHLTASEVQRPEVLETPKVITPSVKDTPAFFSTFYQKLPHPLGQLVNEFTIIDGSDVHHLCEFLLQLLKLRQVGLICTYCKGEILALTQALMASEPFDSFHARVLKQLIPARQFSQLRIEKYERAQKEGESLANYIQAGRDAALILRIVETEAQVVGRIVEGLTPIQRARFVFQAPPISYAQLELLVIVDRNITYADAVREVPVPTGPSNAIETRAVTATARQVQISKKAVISRAISRDITGQNLIPGDGTFEHLGSNHD
jgi:hypothetical protein